MNINSKTVVAGVIASLVFLAGCWLVGNQPVEVFVNIDEDTQLSGLTNFDEMGTTEGYEVDNVQIIDGNGSLVSLVASGDSIAIANSDGSETLTAAQMCDSNHIVLTPSQGAVTVTTPTAALLIADCVSSIGDTKALWYENGAIAATSTTWAAGSNVILTEPSGGDVVITQNEWARVEILNVDGTNVMIQVTSTQDAD